VTSTKVAGNLTVLELILIIWLAVVSFILLIVLIVLCVYCCRQDKDKEKEEAYRRYMAENPYEDPLARKKHTGSLYDATREDSNDFGANGGGTVGAGNGGSNVGRQDSNGDRGPSSPSSYSNAAYSSGTGFDSISPAGGLSSFGKDEDWKQSLREDTFTEFAVDTIERDRNSGRKQTKTSTSSEY